jgi:endonuclease YncB( thermonuclease family)
MSRRAVRRLRPGGLAGLLAGLFLAAASCAEVGPGGPEPAPAPEPLLVAAGPGTFGGRVSGVIDGDTFRIAGLDRRIRVWGLDAPEQGRPGGSAATAALTRLISGQQLGCRQRDIDRYGRIVGQCFLPDGRDITALMIATGTAGEFCSFSGNYYRTC